MLLGSHNVFTKSPRRVWGNGTGVTARANWGGSGALRNRDWVLWVYAALPNGYTPPGCWSMARKSGGIASHNELSGLGDVDAANLAGGRNGTATIAGLGSLSGVGTLVVSALATLAGTGAVSQATASALAHATATLLGTGSVSAAGFVVTVLSALATLTGTGTVSQAALGALTGATSTLSGQGAVSAVIQALGNVSAEIVVSYNPDADAIAAAVWNSIAADFNDAGTMGEKLNDAGSAANPWTEVIEGSLTATQVMRLLLAVAAGRTVITDNGDGTATVAFRDQANTTDRVEATMDGSERTTVTLDPD